MPRIVHIADCDFNIHGETFHGIDELHKHLLSDKVDASKIFSNEKATQSQEPNIKAMEGSNAGNEPIPSKESSNTEGKISENVKEKIDAVKNKDGTVTIKNGKTIMVARNLEHAENIAKKSGSVLNFVDKIEFPKESNTINNNKEQEPTSLKDVLDIHEKSNNSSFNDLVNSVESFAKENGNEKMLTAIDKYRNEQKEDNELSGRGDMDKAENEFQKTLNEEIKSESKKSTSTTTQETGKEQSISSQSNINENDRAHEIGQIPSEIRIGEEPIQANIDKSASGTAVSSSGILETQERQIEEDNRTSQQIAEAEKDYDNREQQVRGYARSENIALTEDEIDHATALVDEDTTPKEAITHVQEETKRELSEAGKKMADRIRQLKILKGGKAYATIFALPIAVYDTAISIIANSVELTGNLAQAIQDGINYIKSQKDLKDWEDDGGHFAKHIEDFVAGEKPKLKVQVEAEKTEPTAEETEKEKAKEVKKELDSYDLTTDTEVNKFASGETWEDIFGEQPEGSQTYAVQKLTDMLQDGKNMIAIAQQKWGNDIMDYGKKLFSYIQNMEARSGNAESNKKAVLLATFLGEIKEAIVNNPNRANEIRKLEAVVLDYYQHYMNIKGKQVVAGRLLRLYRDKYIGDAFANKILEENQIRGRDAFQQAEKDVKITDEVAAKPNDTITEEEKKKEDNSDKKRKKDADKKQESKKSMSTTEAQQRANEKLKEIQDKLGDEKEKGLIAKINDLIKKINCP